MEGGGSDAPWEEGAAKPGTHQEPSPLPFCPCRLNSLGEAFLPIWEVVGQGAKWVLERP